MITNSNLHYTIIKKIIDHGYAPSVSDLSKDLKATEQEVIEGLHTLQAYHGVVLHPHEPKIWVAHPFSLAPTNFYVRSEHGEWWGNCAWCSLGVAALVNDTVRISTVLGGETEQIEIHIIEGEIQEKEYYVHFPVPMKNAWDNVIYTCSNMLIFKTKEAVDKWSKKHNIPKGDVQSIEIIWEFSKKWYGRHLDPNWKKWTIQEAKELFAEFGLDHDIWKLDDTGDSF